MREGTRVSHAKFQVSMSIRSLAVVFYKNEEMGGGGWGAPIILCPKKPIMLFANFCTINSFAGKSFGYFEGGACKGEAYLQTRIKMCGGL